MKTQTRREARTQSQGPHGSVLSTKRREKQVQLTFNVNRGLKTLMAVRTLSMVLVIGGSGISRSDAATADCDRELHRCEGEDHQDQPCKGRHRP